MSINTLKKKSKRFQDKISGKEQGFAINGTFRNQGWVGQSSMGRTLAHTPFRGIAPMGNGGHQGKYRINVIESNGTSITNNSTMVKRSNMNTNGHLLATVEHPTSVFVMIVVVNVKIFGLKISLHLIIVNQLILIIPLE